MTEWRAWYRCRADGMKWDIRGTLEKGGFEPLIEDQLRCPVCVQPGEFVMARQVTDAA